MTTTQLRKADPIGSLRVLLPGEADWDSSRATFNLLTDQHPYAIALPRSVEEVIEAVALARREGLRLTAQGTGHGAMSLGDLTNTLLVNTSLLVDVHIDAAARRVRVGAGARWRDVVPQLSELGLAALHGSSPDVGIAGYSLGGGIGWLARKHGMQTNAVRAIELVTADGAFIRADADTHADLFWALRGGGGNYGVITAIEFEVVEAAELFAGALFFPIDRGTDVLTTWSALLPHLPEDLTTWVTLLHFPPADEVPAEFRAQSFAIVMAAFLGTEDDGRALLAPFLQMSPLMDTLAVQKPAGLATLAMDPEQPVPYRSATALLDALTPSTIADLLSIAGSGSSLTMVQFRHGGGALSRPTAQAGARSTLPGEIVLFALGVVPDPRLEGEVDYQLSAITQAVSASKVGDYPNFVEHPVAAHSFFTPQTWTKLCDVKAAYDPHDLIRGNHHVPPRARVDA